MKPLKQVGQSYLALSEGDRQFQQGFFGDALHSYQRAIEVSRTIPQEEAFDYTGFDAIAHTGISGALVRLERYAEALDSTDIALRYFNRRGELHQGEGVQWIDAVHNRAAALHGVGRLDDALKLYRTVAEMIAERKGYLINKEALLNTIQQNIRKLESAVTSQKKPAGYKAWWEFWS